MKNIILGFLIGVSFLFAHSEEQILEEYITKTGKPLQAACDKGDIQSCGNLGMFYIKAESPNKGVPLLKKSCEGKVALTCTRLGVLYSDGKLAKKDFNKAQEYYTKGCDLKESLACNNLALLYFKGKGVSKDLEITKKLFKKSCSLGSQQGCINLSNFYIQTKEMKKAQNILYKLCDKKEAKSCLKLAYIHYKNREDKKASHYFDISCKQGLKLGCNMVQHINYFQEQPRKCHQGEIEVCTKLGDYHYKKKDYTEAVYYYSKSCEGKIAIGCSKAAKIYFEGQGVKKDLTTAIKMAEKSCKYDKKSCKFFEEIKAKQ